MTSEDEIYSRDIFEQILTVHKRHYGDFDLGVIETVFGDVNDLFSGKRKGFQRCDTQYHDLRHTLQVVPPFIGIIDGWNSSGASPYISHDYFEMGIAAVLLHDTGYIKMSGDTGGTGGKYTFVHIHRSADFAEHYLPELGFEKRKVKSIRNIIMCTGVKVDINDLPFESAEEKIIGFTLGTADLLGQMSAPDYLEKLYALFHEFNEAYHYEGKEKLKKAGITIFESAEDLIRNTPDFYEVVVRERLESMGSVYASLSGNSRNPYIEAVEENIGKIKKAFPRGLNSQTASY
ncbi:MAG TPA: hypothetical protein VK435_02940 [Thermodesulfovibrionales bacterium]|nr:hypothetical protein [Thermodesulfovibrionales bacterium]